MFEMNGWEINFLLDNWYNDYPFSIQFSLVYAKTKITHSSLKEVWNEGQINLHLTRGAGIAMRKEKSDIIFILNFLHFNDQADSSCGTHMGVIQLSLHIFFYVFLRVPINLSRSVWAHKIPLKNKLFLWMALQNKILTKDNLGK
jgi:zinc-binding in reverse transcriptase